MGCPNRLIRSNLKTGPQGPLSLSAPSRREEAPTMKNMNLFGVGMPAGSARDLRVATGLPSHPAHAAHDPPPTAPPGIAARRKRPPARTHASPDGGTP